MRFTIGIMAFLAIVVLILVVVTGAGVLNNPVVAFIDAPSFLFLFLVNVVVVVMTGQTKTFGQATRAVLNKNHRLDPETKERAASLLRLLSTVTMGVAVLSVFTSTIIIIGSLDDLSMLGPYLAISMITVVYALLLKYMVFEPAQFMVKHSPDSKEGGAVQIGDVVRQN
jgi:flagellar motor component MotA